MKEGYPMTSSVHYNFDEVYPIQFFSFDRVMCIQDVFIKQDKENNCKWSLCA